MTVTKRVLCADNSLCVQYVVTSRSASATFCH